MPRTHNLGGPGWQFGSVPRRSWAELDVDDRAGVTEWLPASVPGDVRADLLALGRIPDPFFGDGYQASLWVEDCDWWYRRAWELSIRPGERAFLIFEGIDYLSAVIVNGRELGRREGMFSRQVYEVTDLALPTSEISQTSEVSSAPLEIAVRLWGSGALPRRRLSLLERSWAWLANRIDPTGVGAFPDRTATLKSQMSFGWDFAPPIRAIGIWDDVWLVVTGGVSIEDVWVRSQLANVDSPLAHLAVTVSLDSNQARSVQADVGVGPANFNGPSIGPISFDLDLPAGRSAQTLTFDLPHPKLWQPWDRGFPYLYQLTLSLHPSAPSPQPPAPGPSHFGPPGQPLDAITTRFGIRHITLDNWTLSVNSRREFVRGVNWVPADSLPGRLRREDYAHLLGMVRAAGVNLLRVWGGGLREKRAFYELCDELGLLVWQEFPFACSFLGYFPRDAGWLELAERECAAIVQTTRNHPCLALWCGGNEFSPRRNRPLVERLARLVEIHDGSRPFLPASPSPGDAHNWDVWHGKYPLHAYRREKARFLSEFGLQAAPAPETLRACLPETELWPPGTGWEVHHAELGKLWRYVETTLTPNPSPRWGEGSLEPALGSPGRPERVRAGQAAGSPPRLRRLGRGGWGEGEISASLEEFVAASQRAQALGLQIAIEHMRRRKEEAGGVCLWQFNEPWPAISWAIVDYWRRPKLAYRRLKDLYNPVLVGLTFPPARYRAGDTLHSEVWAVNDSLEALDDCGLVIELDGVRIYEARATLPPDRVQVIGTLYHQFQAEPGELALTLYQGEQIIARNTYDLTYYDPAVPSWRERLVRWLADSLLR